MTKQLEITQKFKNDLEKLIIYLEKENYKIRGVINDEWNYKGAYDPKFT